MGSIWLFLSINGQMRRNDSARGQKERIIGERSLAGIVDLSANCGNIAEASSSGNISEVNVAVEELNAELAKIPDNTHVEKAVGLIDFDIPLLFHEILESLQGSCDSVPILRCIWSLTGLSADIAELFSGEEFIDLFCKLLRSDLAFSVTEPTLSSLFNVLHDQSETVVMNFLSNFSIEDMMSLIKKHEEAPNSFFVKLVRRTLSCFERFSRLPIGEYGNHLLYAVTLVQEFRDRSDVLDAAIANLSMRIIYNMMDSGTLDYDAFCELGLIELVDRQLTTPPVDVHGLVCRIISLLYTDYDCQHCFDVDALLGHVLKGTMDYMSSPAIALGSMMKAHEDMMHVFENVTLRICELVERMNNNMSTRCSILRIVGLIIRNSPGEAIELLIAGNRLVDICEELSNMLGNDEEEILVDALGSVIALLESANEEGRAQLVSFFGENFFEDLESHEDNGDDVVAMIAHIHELLE